MSIARCLPLRPRHAPWGLRSPGLALLVVVLGIGQPAVATAAGDGRPANVPLDGHRLTRDDVVAVARDSASVSVRETVMARVQRSYDLLFELPARTSRSTA